MGQAVKYAALGAAVLVVIGLIVALVGELMGSGPLNEYSQAIASAIGNGSLTSAIQNVRGAINYVFGMPTVVTACLWIMMILPVLKIGIAIPIAVIRFINQ